MSLPCKLSVISVYFELLQRTCISTKEWYLTPHEALFVFLKCNLLKKRTISCTKRYRSKFWKEGKKGVYVVFLSLFFFWFFKFYPCMSPCVYRSWLLWGIFFFLPLDLFRFCPSQVFFILLFLFHGPNGERLGLLT